MKAFTSVLTITVALTLVTGCLPSQRQLRLERDLEEMKRHLAQLETGGAEGDFRPGVGIGDRMAELRRQQAEVQAGLDALRVEFQSVQGRLEDLQRTARQQQEELALVREDLTLRISELEEGKPSKPAPPKKREGEKGESPEELYQWGLDLIRGKKEYAAGAKIMEDFLKRFPEHQLRVNAMYWIGEAYYAQKKYEEAILQFQDVLQQGGEHSKRASAMLMQGMAFVGLGDGKNAAPIFERLIQEYPESGEAKKARDQLKALGKK